MARTNGDRNGKHKPGKVRMGIYTIPFRKAVALVVADQLDMNLTDVWWHGVSSLAIGLGIIDSDGNPTEAFRDAITLSLEIVKQSEVQG